MFYMWSTEVHLKYHAKRVWDAGPMGPTPRELLDMNWESTLTAWFEYNRAQKAGQHVPDDPDALNVLYHDFPKFFTFDKNCPKRWHRRRRHCDQLGRLHMVSPREGERYYLRMLLLHRPGVTSFEDMRTVDGTSVLVCRLIC